MPDADFSFSGTDPHDLADKLERFEEVLVSELEEALETWVLMVEGTAKQTVPVDTGRLRGSISSEVRRAGKSIIKGAIGSGVEYAPFVEMGTSRMDAQPFLRPSIEAHRDDLRRLAAEAVDNATAAVS